MHKARQQAGSTSFLPTSLHKLDVALHGGLPPATITEVTHIDDVMLPSLAVLVVCSLYMYMYMYIIVKLPN